MTDSDPDQPRSFDWGRFLRTGAWRLLMFVRDALPLLLIGGFLFDWIAGRSDLTSLIFGALGVGVVLLALQTALVNVVNSFAAPHVVTAVERGIVAVHVVGILGCGLAVLMPWMGLTGALSAVILLAIVYGFLAWRRLARARTRTS